MMLTRAVLATLVLALIAPASSHAAAQWHDGSTEKSTVTNCNFMPETGINALAQRYHDAPPKVGEVFYVRTIPARTGNGCGIGMSAHVELVLPDGVALAISSKHPVRCLDWDYVTDVSTPAGGCPQTPQAGIYGPAFDQETQNGPRPWTIAHGKGLAIEVPIRATRSMQGTGPTCGRNLGDPPCAPDKLGDSAQWGIWISDGRLDPWLSPYVELGVAAAPKGTAPAPTVPTQPPVRTGAPTTRALAVTVARSLRMRALRRGIPVTVEVPTAGSSVDVALKAKSKTLAKGRKRGASAGKTTIRLRVTKRRLAALRRTGKKTVGQVQVKLTAPDGTRTTARRNVRIRR